MKWSTENIDKLKELINFDLSAKAIFDMQIFSDRSQNAIKKMILKLKVHENKNDFPMEIEQRFRSFLLQNWIGKTPEELANIWSVQNAKFIITEQTIINKLLNMGIKISYNEVQQIKNLRKKEEEIRHSKFSSSSEMLETLKMERIKLMQNRVVENKDIWSGIAFP